MSVKARGWDAICDGCGRPYGPTFDSRAEALMFDREAGFECLDCASDRRRSAEGAQKKEDG